MTKTRLVFGSWSHGWRHLFLHTPLFDHETNKVEILGNSARCSTCHTILHGRQTPPCSTSPSRSFWPLQTSYVCLEESYFWLPQQTAPSGNRVVDVKHCFPVKTSTHMIFWPVTQHFEHPPVRNVGPGPCADKGRWCASHNFVNGSWFLGFEWRTKHSQIIQAHLRYHSFTKLHVSFKVYPKQLKLSEYKMILV